MFLPIGDSPNPSGTPWATYALIAINILVYLALFPLAFEAPAPDDPELVDYLTTIAQERQLSLAQVRQLAGQVSAYDLVVYRHGLRPGAPSAVDVLTSMFLHGGLLHLFGNMLFLWIYGDNVEQRLGHLVYLGAYLGTGVAAAIGDGILRMGSNIPSVGASGAISGVLGLYFVWFPRNRVRVWMFLFPFYVGVVELRARLVLGFYIVVENILPLLLAGGSGGVSHGAHIGGFVAGLGAALLVDRRSLARPEADLRRRPATVSTSGEGVESFRRALETGRWDAAAEWFFGAPHSRTRAGVSAGDKVLLGRELERNGHPHAALAAFQRALADHPVDPNRGAAHLGAARVLMGPLRNPTGAYQHLYAVLEERSTAEEASEARRMLDELALMMRSVPRTLPR